MTSTPSSSPYSMPFGAAGVDFAASAPIKRSKVNDGGDPLSSPQEAAVIGEPIPIVFARRVGSVGGVLVSPKATEARFSNSLVNEVTASYHLVISEGQLPPAQNRDVFQQSCRVGTFTQSYDRRAGDWEPGNFIVPRVGYTTPDCPIYCGSAEGRYAGMTTGSFTVTIPDGFNQWDRQIHIFYREGMEVPRILDGITGPSNNYVDLFMWGIQRSSRIPPEMLDTASLTSAALFTDANGLWFNGEIKESTNLADWISEHSSYFLLREVTRAGKRGLRPLLPFDAVTGEISTAPVGAIRRYFASDIVPGSMSVEYVNGVDGAAFTVQAMWRQQPEGGLGLARTSDIRYAGSATDVPLEQYDLSVFATSENHAYKVGAYFAARRRHIDHRATVSILPGDVRDILVQGDIVRLTLPATVSLGGKLNWDYLYEVDQIARTADGGIELSLTHFPVDALGRSLVALDVDAAVGSGLVLPTGRAAVDCDANDPNDETSEPEPDPWEGWEPADPDLPIYDGDPLPDGVVIDPDTDWGAGYPPADDLDLADPDPPVDLELTITLSEPLIVYPDVYYLVADPLYARVIFRAELSAEFGDDMLQITVTDGSVSVDLLAQRNQTKTAEVGINGSGNPEQTFGGCADRVLSVTAPTAPRRFRPADHAAFAPYSTAEFTSTPQDYKICGYATALRWGETGAWTRSGSDWVWDIETKPEPSDWSWDEPNQEWDYIGEPDDNWNWTGAGWGYIGSEPRRPEAPPSPPAVPDSLPPALDGGDPGRYVSFTVTLNSPQMPVVDDLVVDLETTLSSNAGQITIPAVSALWGNWRWIAATNEWERRNNPGDTASPQIINDHWRWHSQLKAWQVVGIQGTYWTYQMPNPVEGTGAFTYIGEGIPDWEWIPAEPPPNLPDVAGWNWTAGGAPAPPPGGLPTPPAGPPTQGGSIYPPDAATWAYNGSIWEGGVYGPDGTPPMGVWEGSTTLHIYQLPEEGP
jgi:hypothetical protein